MGGGGRSGDGVVVVESGLTIGPWARFDVVQRKLDFFSQSLVKSGPILPIAFRLILGNVR